MYSLVDGMWCIVHHERSCILLSACEVGKHGVHKILLHQPLGLDIHAIVPAGDKHGEGIAAAITQRIGGAHAQAAILHTML